VILVAGGGAIGAGIAYRLALRGAEEVVLCDRGPVCSGSTAQAMGGVRQQFSTAAEVRLAQESIAFFAELGPPLFDQVGYLFLATTEPGLAELEQRRALQATLGVPVVQVDAAFVAGLETGDVLGAVFCAEDGVADPPGVTRELVRRATALGVEVREHTPAESLLAAADTVVIACGPWSAAFAAAVGVELPVRPLCRQLLATEPLGSPPPFLPMVVEAESGFHFRRRGDRLVLAMADDAPRFGFETEVDGTVFSDRLARLAHRFPPAAGCRIDEAWAGLYDMTPDAHPILGRVAEGVYAACGFSGHGFMQSPAVAAAIAELILDGESTIDLTPYRLERFLGGSGFPETVVL
jgi:sarcosine oxidase, subunit beta